MIFVKANRYLGLFGLGLVLLVMPCDVVAGSDFAKSVGAMLGTQVSSTTLEVDDLYSFIVAGDFIVVKTGEKEGPTTTFTIYNAETLEEIWSVSGPYWTFATSSGSRPTIILYERGNEQFDLISVHDLSTGALLFEQQNIEEAVYSSPNGQFFHTNSLDGRFKLFSRGGVRLPTDSLGLHSRWWASAVNDSVIAYADWEGLRMLSVPGGDELARIAKPTGRTGSHAIMKAGRGASAMFVSWYGQMICIGSQFEVLWQSPSVGAFCDAAFSEDGRYVAILSTEKGTKQRITLVETHTGNELGMTELPQRGFSGPSRWETMRFTGEYLSLITSYIDFIVDGEVGRQTKTHLYRVDQTSGDLLSSSSFDGVAYLGFIDEKVVVHSISPDDRHVITAGGWNVTSER